MLGKPPLFVPFHMRVHGVVFRTRGLFAWLVVPPRYARLHNQRALAAELTNASLLAKMQLPGRKDHRQFFKERNNRKVSRVVVHAILDRNKHRSVMPLFCNGVRRGGAKQ